MCIRVKLLKNTVRLLSRTVLVIEIWNILNSVGEFASLKNIRFRKNSPSGREVSGKNIFKNLFILVLKKRKELIKERDRKTAGVTISKETNTGMLVIKINSIPAIGFGFRELYFVICKDFLPYSPFSIFYHSL